MQTKMLFFLIALLISTKAMKLSHEKSIFDYWGEMDDQSCYYDENCDGLRICYKQQCSGQARPPKDADYFYDQIQNGCATAYNDYSKKYIKDYYCDNMRTCENGKCTGGNIPRRPPKTNTYYYNESTTGIRCPTSSSSDYWNRDYFCDGLRTCSQWGWCQGAVRAPRNGLFYYFDESSNGNTCPDSTDSRYPIKDYFCDGLRTCSYGKCQGTARQLKNPSYVYDEKKNNSRCLDSSVDPKMKAAIGDYYCIGERKCSQLGQCINYTRPPKTANYKFDEKANNSKCPASPSDPNYPNRDYFCNGKRTCSNLGGCIGNVY